MEKQPLEVSNLFHTAHFTHLIQAVPSYTHFAVSKSWKPITDLEKQHLPALFLLCTLIRCCTYELAAKEMPASKKQRIMEWFR